MNDFRYYNYENIDSHDKDESFEHRTGKHMAYKPLIGNKSSGDFTEPKTYFTQYLDSKGKEDKNEKKMAEFLKKR
jgi:hypothetical protein